MGLEGIVSKRLSAPYRGLVWQLHRIIARQLSEIQGEVNAPMNVFPRAFMMQLNDKTGNEASSSDITPRKNDGHENDVLRELEMELEETEIDELCAKLIILVPPEAAPLLEPERPPTGARERNDHSNNKTPRLQDGLRPNPRARPPGSARGYLPAASPPRRGRLSQRPFAPTGSRYSGITDVHGLHHRPPSRSDLAGCGPVVATPRATSRPRRWSIMV